MKLTEIGEVSLKMYPSPWSTRHHRCVLTNISKYLQFSETKRTNLNNIDTWQVNSFGFRISELEMATNESFETGVQISSIPIFKMADRKKYVNEHVSSIVQKGIQIAAHWLINRGKEYHVV